MNKIQLAVVAIALLSMQILLLPIARAQVLYPIEVNHQPEKIKISNIQVTKHNEQLVVSGVVNRRAYNSHVLPGHIDLVIFDTNKHILKQGIIKVSGLNLCHNRYGRQFRIAFDNDLPEGSYIKMGWHHNQNSQLTDKSHFYKQSSLL